MKRIHLFFVACLAFVTTSSIFAQPIINIPDANFKAYLLGNSSINTTAGPDIDSAEAASYSGLLNIPYLAITNLTGIEAFVSIDTLFANGNLLTTVDVSSNVELTYLSLSDNQLIGIDVTNNINLYSLDVSNNFLTSIDVSNISGLYHLDFSYNSVSTVNLVNNTGLHELYCDSNQLSVLDLQNNYNLYQLYCTQNFITTLDVGPLYDLAVLFANENLFSCVDVSLNYFLSNLSLQNCPNLQKLNLKNGNNGFLSPVVSGCPVLICVQVDDTAYANSMWVSFGGSSYFSLDCGQPVASFTHNAPVCNGTPVSFDQTIANVDWFKWDFGNGDTTTAIDPSYLYTFGGNYYVTLTTKNCYGTSVPYADVILGNLLFGDINYSLGPVGLGDIILMKYEPFYTSFDTVLIAPFESVGEYDFGYVFDGDYIIKVYPDIATYPTLIPTYSGDDANWESAFVINHSCVADDSLNITMVELINATPGTGSVSGEIVEGAGFGRAQGDPVHGVDVKLGLTSSQIMAHTTTDTLGNYYFTNLPFGTYTIFVDIAGLLKDSSYTITVDSSMGSWTYLDYIVDSVSIYIVGNIGIEEQFETNPNTLDVYPNPVKINGMIRLMLDYLFILQQKFHQCIFSGLYSKFLNTVGSMRLNSFFAYK